MKIEHRWLTYCLALLLGLPAVAEEPDWGVGSKLRLTTLPPPIMPTATGYLLVGNIIEDGEDFVTYRQQGSTEVVSRAKEGHLLIGRLRAVDERYLTLAVLDAREPVRVAKASVVILEVSRGIVQPIGARKGATRGALVGFASGVLMGATIPWAEPEDRVQDSLLAGLVFGAAGGLVGALFGSVAGAPERWERRDVPRWSVDVTPGWGLRARLAIRF